jgi:carbonic anhydrase
MSSNRIVEIKSAEEIPAIYKGTAIELLLRYQNLGVPHAKYQQAQILIGMCIDYRKSLNIPENFAYMIRTAGANLMRNEFKVSFAVGVGGVSTIALIGHTQCGMADLHSKKEVFIQGLVDRAGWTREAAEAHFNHNAPSHEIVNEADFVRSEAKRLKARYPKVLVAPFIYKVEDGLLYLLT